MTTDRRRARGGSMSAAIVVGGKLAPAELLDSGAPCWQSNDSYTAFLQAHGLSSRLVTYRLGVDGHAGNRRNYAAEAWAEKAGVLLDDRFSHPRACWHKLRAAGLID